MNFILSKRFLSTLDIFQNQGGYLQEIFLLYYIKQKLLVVIEILFKCFDNSLNNTVFLERINSILICNESSVHIWLKFT